jgi:hypothetical protein
MGRHGDRGRAAGREKTGCPSPPGPPSVLLVGINAIFFSGHGRGCTYSIRMRRAPGALTGPGDHVR